MSAKIVFFIGSGNSGKEHRVRKLVRKGFKSLPESDISGFLWNEQRSYFSKAALVELLVEPALVAAMGGVGLEDVTVASFKFSIHRTLFHSTGADIIGQHTKQQGSIRRKVFEYGYKFPQVFS